MDDLVEHSSLNAGAGRKAFAAAMLAVAASAVLTLAPRPTAAGTPDYALFDEALLQNVRNGYVDYDGIKANPGFAEFLRQLAGKPDGLEGPGAELAYYINAYNAFAIRGILDGYSPASRLGRHRYFKSAKFTLGGAEITLEDLEQKRIRPQGDPRIHFAIVCASISCPRLSNRAYLPSTLDAQLEDAAQRFINDVTRNRFDIPQKTAFISEIFDSFGDDFAQAAGSVPGYLARYVQEPATRAALTEGRLAIRHLPYDWDLNGRYAGTSPN
jgi:hypothetical protein